MDCTFTQQLLARHIIGWSYTPPALTGNESLSLSGCQQYLEMAGRQQASLAFTLGADPEDLSRFLAYGGSLDAYFCQQRPPLPWMDGGDIEGLVLADLGRLHGEVDRLKSILGVWTASHAGLASDVQLTPFTGVQALRELFSGFSVFASELLSALSNNLSEGILRFYDLEERRRRGLAHREARRPVSPTLRKPLETDSA